MAVSTSTAILAGLGALNATTQIWAGHQQSKSLKEQGSYNAQVYEQQAEMIKQQKKLEEYQYNRQLAKIRGAVVARTAGKGLNLSGSPLAIMIDNETQMQLDKLAGQYNLDMQARYASGMSSNMLKTAKEQGKLSKMQGYTNAFSTMMNTGMTAYSWGKAARLPLNTAIQ